MDRSGVDLAAKLIAKAQSTQYEAEAMALVCKAHDLLGVVVGERLVVSRSVGGARGSSSGGTSEPLLVESRHADRDWRSGDATADPHEAAGEEVPASTVRHIDVFA